MKHSKKKRIRKFENYKVAFMQLPELKSHTHRQTDNQPKRTKRNDDCH